MADATRTTRATRARRDTPRPATTRPATTRPAAARPAAARAATDRRAARSHRLVDHLRSRVALATLGSLFVVAIVAALVVLPVRTWLDQRNELETKREEVATLERANASLSGDVEQLQTPGGIEDTARVELGYQMPGETRVATNRAPDAPVELPAGWPYSTVLEILAVRRSGG